MEVLMVKTNFKKILGTICLCTMLFTVVAFSTACESRDSLTAGKDVEITTEKLLEANDTSKILNQYQTITSKLISTDRDGRKSTAYTSCYKDVNGNTVMQSECKYDNGEFSYSSANFDGIIANLWPAAVVTFVVTDDWNANSINQFNPFSKDGNYEIIGDIKIENDKIVVKTSNFIVDETVTYTNYFNKDTLLIEKMESTATNDAGEVTFQSVEEYFYGKQIIESSTAYQVFALAHVGLSPLKVNYVDTNESRIYYINRNARLFNVVDYDNLEVEYKVYSDSACTVEFTTGTLFGETKELWIKKVAE